MEGSSFRCWICLEDQPSTHAMLSACDCVGTNRYVHESCLNTYCLRTLADNEHRQHDLDVCCPICRGKYIIEREASSVASWRELVRCTSTDWQLLLRHCRFFLLILPVSLSTLTLFLIIFLEEYNCEPEHSLLYSQPLYAIDTIV